MSDEITTDFHGMEKNGLVWNGLRWKKKDEGPDEDEGYLRPFLLEEPGIHIPYSPLQDQPGWPHVIDPELAAFEYDDPFKEDHEPIAMEDLRADKTKEDVTYIPPWLRKFIPPPTPLALRQRDELLNTPCYIDDDPRNLWLYKEPPGPFLANSVCRQEWGAQGWKPLTPLNLPVKHVRFTYTDGPTDDFPEALGIMQDLQKQHKEQGMQDIAYNQVIGRDGAIYEGRGWYVDAERPEAFKHLKGDCLDIAYLGNFADSDPPWYLQKAAVEILNYAVQIRVLDPNFTVIQYRSNQLNKPT